MTSASDDAARPIAAGSWLWAVTLLFAVSVGAARAWSHRFAMNPDGISYLDLARALGDGRWGDLLNGYWSPLLPLLNALARGLLLPDMGSEFPLAHLVQFGIFLFSLGTWNLLVWKLAGATRTGLPGWLVASLANLLYTWVAVWCNYLRLITPDALAFGLLFLAFAIVVRDGEALGRRRAFALGLVLGLGYLASWVLLYVAVALFGMLALDLVKHRQSLRPLLSGAGGLALVIVPFIVGLSLSKGRPTIGDKGRLSYAWLVNDVEWFTHWRGDPPGSGEAVHPSTRLEALVPIYFYDGPVGGTYPGWYDPAYWNEGLVARFRLGQQLRYLARVSVPRLARSFAKPADALVVLAWLVMSITCWRSAFSRYWLRWALLLGVPVTVHFSAYLLIRAVPRFVGGLLLVALVLVLLCGEFPKRRLRRAVFGASLLAYVGGVGLGTLPDLARATDDMSVRQSSEVTADRHLLMAQQLHAAGVGPGERIGLIGDPFSAYWAYHARLQIVAEIPHRGDRWKGENLARFRRLGVHGQCQVLQRFADAGVRYIVTTHLPARSLSPSWERLGGNLLLYDLARAGACQDEAAGARARVWGRFTRFHRSGQDGAILC